MPFAQPNDREECNVPYDAEAIAVFGYELGLLKRIRRSGWWHAGVRDPESVAEHTMRTAQLAAMIAAEEGADPTRASYLALWHDSQETRTITGDQTESLPERSRESVRGAVDEYESRQTLESLCSKDADKLEMLLQAVEYRDVGVQRVEGWIAPARDDLKTRTGRLIADAAMSVSSLAWRDR
jgi:putative hydrolase of HD superfamily